MEQLVTTQAFELQLLTIAKQAAAGVAGPLDQSELRLGQADVTPTPTTPLADMTIADYDGYANEAITWSANTVADDGSVEVIGVAGEFRPTGSVTPNDIYTYCILDGAGVLLAAGRFPDAPVPMASALDQILITLRQRFLPQSFAEIIT